MTGDGKTKKLKLNRETFRRLTSEELNQVAGGRFSSNPQYCTCSVTYWESVTGQGPTECKTVAP